MSETKPRDIMAHQTSGRSYSTHGAFNRCQVARQQWVWSKVTTQCVSCHLHAGTQAGGEYLAFFSGCTSQAATRCAMMKRALKVPDGVVSDRNQHMPPRLDHHATSRAAGHAAKSTHGPGHAAESTHGPGGLVLHAHRPLPLPILWTQSPHLARPAHVRTHCSAVCAKC